MTDNAWTRWPSREALSREGVHTARRVFGRVTRSIALGILIATTLTNTELNGWALAGGAVGIVVCGFLAWAFWRTTLENRLLPSLGLLAALLTIATVGQGWGSGSRLSSCCAAAPSMPSNGCPSRTRCPPRVWPCARSRRSTTTPG